MAASAGACEIPCLLFGIPMVDSLSLAKLNKNLNIYTFEPIPKTFDYLVKNIQLNHSGHIKCFNLGFSNAEDTTPFFITTRFRAMLLWQMFQIERTLRYRNAK